MENKVEEIYKGIGIIRRRNNIEWKNRQVEPVSTLYRNKV
jgi:hypothetical protein